MNMNENLISEFMELGISQKLAAVTLQVYLELCEVKRYYEVQYFFNAKLKRVLLKAKIKNEGPVYTFIPYPYSDDLSMVSIQEFLIACKEECIVFAFLHPDSTCVYYQISRGLLEPTEISVKHLKENKQEKLDAELKKNRKILEQAALLGIPVTLKKDCANKEGSNTDNKVKER